jgi:ribosomal-protein-alanine N-acetyltransferase
MTTPTFTTKRLILKTPTLEDAPHLQHHIANWEVARFFSKKFPWPYPQDGALTFIRDVVIPNQGKTRWTWGIFHQDNKAELIGIIELFNDPNIQWNRGFWISQNYWNKGYMSEAIIPINQYAFTELKFEKLIFSNAKKNIGSSKIKQKTGGTFLRFEKSEFVDPSLTESEVWELTKQDWDSN